MSFEIERKFLVKENSWRAKGEGILYRQGYLSLKKEHVVRVRIIGDKGYLTIKSKSQGASRIEFEYEIPFQDAQYMLEHLCEKPLIEKKRYKIEEKGLLWEIDEFFNENEGLILAEVEISSENQPIDLPAWIDKEVTGQPKYYNSNLIKNPYKTWKSVKKFQEPKISPP
ncbi:MAG: CYTH domain-containing protein [Candidatus Marinimicrobia bacterium]|nr:CYTH domain-containing protein [Candidatus Neomarinimicrobiota bacterium]